MYYIYDVKYPNRPYEFQDQDKGIQEPAIFDTKDKADKMCEMMNSIAHRSYFAVKEVKR